jgi:phosphoribosylaminoimidazolecarboxamide formyltransferase/IMP cyclohydrolase
LILATKTALLSVSDKTGIIAFARNLKKLGYEIISTGGTAALLRKNKISVAEVASLTGFPEILGGRVKTLHPAVFGGILATGSKSHAAELKKHGLSKIDLVCVNLYPFAETIANPKVKLAAAVEEIDIGGVSLLRAAAKNFDQVVVASHPDQYTEIAAGLKSGQLKAKERRSLAAAAFAQTAKYDGLITGYLGGEAYFTPIYEAAKRLRYGENPHQEAVLYREPGDRTGVASAEVLQGKPLSFNNLVDAEVAERIVADYAEPTAAVIKHACPCGIASHPKIEVALKNALEADKKSPFGGIIALNQPVNRQTAEIIRPLFIEVIIAPSFDPAARKILAAKQNLRLLALGEIQNDPNAIEVKKVSGGLLVQSCDQRIVTAADFQVTTKRPPSKTEIADLVFAANAVKHAKSNAIVLAKDKITIAIGAGQTARVDAVDIAIAKAGTRASGSVLASDAFFPFADSIEAAARAGITAIVQPGGSIRDCEVVKAADAANIAMVFSGVRAFRH